MRHRATVRAACVRVFGTLSEYLSLLNNDDRGGAAPPPLKGRECGYIHIEAEPRDYTALKPPRLILVIKYAIEPTPRPSTF